MYDPQLGESLHMMAQSIPDLFAAFGTQDPGLTMMDFIINYLASSLKVEPRDEELKYWGVRGPKTFYYTVLTWETVMVKLLSLKDLKSLVSKGLVSEEELPRYYGDLIGSSVKFETMMNYIDKCLGMFVNRGAKNTIKLLRKESFKNKFIKNLIEEANKLDIDKDELLEMIKQYKGGN